MRLKMSSAKWVPFCLSLNVLTRRGRVMHSVSKLSKSISLVQTMVGFASTHYLNQCLHIVHEIIGNTFMYVSIKIQQFSRNKMNLEMSSAKWQPFVLATILTFWVHRMEMGTLQHLIRRLKFQWRHRLMFCRFVCWQQVPSLIAVMQIHYVIN